LTYRGTPSQDNRLVQIECFDPHEPFFSYGDYQSYYDTDYTGPHFDWPDYKKVDEAPEEVAHARNEYAALLSMCDRSLGRVMDFMDANQMWDDTYLMVCTDHGFLLGEHGWWGKNVQPWYDENIHTPLFIWDPRSRVAGARRDALVQTIDLGPTLLDLFEVSPTDRMMGRSLAETTATNAPVHRAGLFGSYGGHVSVTDGRYVYMRACATPENGPLLEHTLMPTHMNARFTPAELAGAELVGPLSFTQGAPVLRMPGFSFGNPYLFGSLLFDLEQDPDQNHPLVDDELELRMITELVELMRDSDAPESQYERLGLPATGDPDDSHLLVRQQFHQVLASTAPLPDPADFRSDGLGVNSTLGTLMGDPAARTMITPVIGGMPTPMVQVLGDLPLIRMATFSPGLTADLLHQLDAELASLPTA
jgi:hypothetical protein